MRDLNYDLKQLCRPTAMVATPPDQLHEKGFRHMDAHSLKPKHVEQLVERWLAEKLSAGTMKNRMTALRWWAEKIGKENVVSDHFGEKVNECHVRTALAKIQLDVAFVLVALYLPIFSLADTIH